MVSGNGAEYLLLAMVAGKNRAFINPPEADEPFNQLSMKKNQIK